MRPLSLLSLILLNACNTTLELPPLAEQAPYVHPSDLPVIEGLPELMTLSTGESVRSERDWQRARRPEIAGVGGRRSNSSRVATAATTASRTAFASPSAGKTKCAPPSAPSKNFWSRRKS